jgi:hypothetical protein
VDGFLDVVALVVTEVLFVVALGGAVLALDFSPGAEVGLIEEAGFGLGVEAELEGEEGEALDEEAFERGGGAEVAAEVFEDGGVVRAVGVGDEGVGVQTGGEGVGLCVVGLWCVVRGPVRQAQGGQLSVVGCGGSRVRGGHGSPPLG